MIVAELRDGDRPSFILFLRGPILGCWIASVAVSLNTLVSHMGMAFYQGVASFVTSTRRAQPQFL